MSTTTRILVASLLSQEPCHQGESHAQKDQLPEFAGLDTLSPGRPSTPSSDGEPHSCADQTPRHSHRDAAGASLLTPAEVWYSRDPLLSDATSLPNVPLEYLDARDASIALLGVTFDRPTQSRGIEHVAQASFSSYPTFVHVDETFSSENFAGSSRLPERQIVENSDSVFQDPDPWSDVQPVLIDSQYATSSARLDLNIPFDCFTTQPYQLPSTGIMQAYNLPNAVVDVDFAAQDCLAWPQSQWLPAHWGCSCVFGCRIPTTELPMYLQHSLEDEEVCYLPFCASGFVNGFPPHSYLKFSQGTDACAPTSFTRQFMTLDGGKDSCADPAVQWYGWTKGKCRYQVV